MEPLISDYSRLNPVVVLGIKIEDWERQNADTLPVGLLDIFLPIGDASDANRN